MSTETLDETTDEASGHAFHPAPRDYVHIAAVLGVLTGLEVSTYFVDFGVIAIPMLVLLMVVKFIYVAGWFMHLKFDTKVYKRLMYTGLAFALVLYAIVAVVTLFDHTPLV